MEETDGIHLRLTPIRSFCGSQRRSCKSLNRVRTSNGNLLISRLLIKHFNYFPTLLYRTFSDTTSALYLLCSLDCDLSRCPARTSYSHNQYLYFKANIRQSSTRRILIEFVILANGRINPRVISEGDSTCSLNTAIQHYKP